MRNRFIAPILSAAMATALAGCLAAPAFAEPGSWLEPPGGLPKLSQQTLPKTGRGDRTQNLDFLFGALKVAPDETTAKAIEQRIWALWVVSPSDTANLLMLRVRTAIEAKDTDLAIKLLDGIVKIKPDYVEAWNRRATLYYGKKDYGHSLADIREVLKREPRHFGALMGLGLIMQDVGDDKQALEVYRRALAVYPKLPRIPDLVKTLQEKVEGRDI
jgi:tetratricopeptide (TPR) repeat protein